MLENVLTDTHSEDVVHLKYRGRNVAEVPLLNFRMFAPAAVISRLKIESVESEEPRDFYTLELSLASSERGAQQWASWLTYRDIRAVVSDAVISDPTFGLHWALWSPLNDAEFIQDIDY